MRFAYADPPYLGCAVRLYGDHPDAAVYDTVEGHAQLIDRLVDDYPDGWALSLHVPSLRIMLDLCPDDVRVAAWVKPWCSFKTANPAYTWEPVIFRGGRSWSERGGRKAVTTRDYLAEPVTTGQAVKGAKPQAFCRWIFDLLGAVPSDEMHDLFPGSGAVGRAWDAWCAARPLDFTAGAYENVELGA